MSLQKVIVRTLKALWAKCPGEDAILIVSQDLIEDFVRVKIPCHNHLIMTQGEFSRELSFYKSQFEEARKDSQRLDWIDKNASFVCNDPYKIGPYKVGELRKMADDGIAFDLKPNTLRQELGEGE